jgi:adenylate cyclase
MKKSILLLTITLLALSSFAQDQHLIDSLEAQLKSLRAIKLELGKLAPKPNDTTEANILSKLSKAYGNSNPDKAMDYANQCLSLSELIGFKKGMGIAYNSMGTIERNKGNYLPALELHKKALKINEEIGDKKGTAGSYNGIGNVYTDQGNYPEALKNHFASLKIIEEIGDKKGIAASYNNIGNIYINQGNYSKALKNYFASLKIMEELGDKSGIATNYGNIGIIYNNQGNYPVALKNYFESLKIMEELGDKNGIAFCYINIGEAYTNQKKYNDASAYLNKALTFAKEIGSLDIIEDSYANLATLDSAQGNFNKALEHYKLFITYRDSLENTENTKKTLALQMNYDFDKKQDSLNAIQTKKDLIAANEKNKQRLLRNGFIGGFAVMLLFAGVFFIQRNKIKKGKQKSDELLLNILPSEVAEELKDSGNSKARNFDEATVMFTDFKDFTNISEKMSPEELVKEIDTCFSAFDHIIHKYGIEKIKTIGDAYMCAGGLPDANNSHAEDVVKAALEIRDFMTNHNKEKITRGEFPFEIRIGINTGPVVAGIVGVRKFAYDIWGDTVNLSNRMESHGKAGKVNISGSTYELVKNKYTCIHRGKIMTKSKGEIDMYFVEEQV